MQERVKDFLMDLEKQIQRLLREEEGMAALLIANLFVDHGIAPAEVLRALEQAGLPDTVTFWVRKKVFSSLNVAKILMFNQLNSPSC